MKNSRMKICTLLLLAVVGVTGCGDKLISLTPDQENLVVSYSAHIVSKFNKNQTDGIADMGSSETESANTNKQAQSQSSQVVKASTNSQTEVQNNQKTQDVSKQTQNSTSAMENQKQPVLEEKALTDALGIAPISATVVSYGIEDKITDQSFTFTLSPEQGKQSLVLHIDLANAGGSDATCDLLSKQPVFQILVNGTIQVVAENSSLQSDLSAYNQVIKAGATNNTVLIFSIPQSEASNIKSLELVTKVNDVSSTTKIL